MPLRRYKQELWRLEHIDASKLPAMGFYGNKSARVLRCIDGDTVKVVVVVDDNAVIASVRLAGIDAPELRPSRQNAHRDDIKREAKAAKKALEQLLPQNTLCTLHCNSPLDCYGRILATRISVGKTEVISEIVRRGFAVRIDGKARQTNWPRMWQDLKTQRLAYATEIAHKHQQKERKIQQRSKRRWKTWFCV